MNTAVVEAMSFQDKLKKRIQEQIGELMSDEDLKRLVDAAMHDAFFKPKVRNNGYHTTEEPAVLESILRDLLRSQVQTLVKEYLKENAEVVEKIVKQTLEVDFATIVAAGFNQLFQNDLYQLQTNISNRLSQLRL